MQQQQSMQSIRTVRFLCDMNPLQCCNCCTLGAPTSLPISRPTLHLPLLSQLSHTNSSIRVNGTQIPFPHRAFTLATTAALAGVHHIVCCCCFSGCSNCQGEAGLLLSQGMEQLLTRHPALTRTKVRIYGAGQKQVTSRCFQVTMTVSCTPRTGTHLLHLLPRSSLVLAQGESV